MIMQPYYTAQGCKVTERRHVDKTQVINTEIILEGPNDDINEQRHTGNLCLTGRENY